MQHMLRSFIVRNFAPPAFLWVVRAPMDASQGIIALTEHCANRTSRGKSEALHVPCRAPQGRAFSHRYLAPEDLFVHAWNAQLCISLVRTRVGSQSRWGGQPIPYSDFYPQVQTPGSSGNPFCAGSLPLPYRVLYQFRTMPLAARPGWTLGVLTGTHRDVSSSSDRHSENTKNVQDSQQPVRASIAHGAPGFELPYPFAPPTLRGQLK